MVKKLVNVKSVSWKKERFKDTSVPLSYFYQEYLEDRAIWNYFIESVNKARIIALINDDGDNAYFIALFPFGWARFAYVNVWSDGRDYTQENNFLSKVYPRSSLFEEIHVVDAQAVSDYRNEVLGALYEDSRGQPQFNTGEYFEGELDYNMVVGQTENPQRFFDLNKRWVKKAYTLYNRVPNVVMGDLTSFSERAWQELEGIYTGYVDNLGVYIPNGFEIDRVLTDWYHEELGISEDRPYVVCRMTALPSHYSNWLAYQNWTISHSGTVGGGVETYSFDVAPTYRGTTGSTAGGSSTHVEGSITSIGGFNPSFIINEIVGKLTRIVDRIKFVFPRVRAFERQQHAVKSYTQLLNDWARTRWESEFSHYWLADMTESERTEFFFWQVTGAIATGGISALVIGILSSLTRQQTIVTEALESMFNPMQIEQDFVVPITATQFAAFLGELTSEGVVTSLIAPRTEPLDASLFEIPSSQRYSDWRSYSKSHVETLIGQTTLPAGSYRGDVVNQALGFDYMWDFETVAIRQNRSVYVLWARDFAAGGDRGRWWEE